MRASFTGWGQSWIACWQCLLWLWSLALPSCVTRPNPNLSKLGTHSVDRNPSLWLLCGWEKRMSTRCSAQCLCGASSDKVRAITANAICIITPSTEPGRLPRNPMLEGWCYVGLNSKSASNGSSRGHTQLETGMPHVHHLASWLGQHTSWQCHHVMTASKPCSEFSGF